MVEKKPRRRIRIDRKGSPAPLAREVEVIRGDGRHERVSCFRAARLITEGAARPGPWDKADLEAVDAADTLRKQRQIDRLRRDGLMVEDGAPSHSNPVPLGSLRDLFGSLFWRER